MENDAKSAYTINFTRKSLTFLAKHTSLSEPEAVKHFIATLKNKKENQLPTDTKGIYALRTTTIANTIKSNWTCQPTNPRRPNTYHPQKKKHSC
jgi:hypothetical protein